jgi:hypothetical protein
LDICIVFDKKIELNFNKGQKQKPSEAFPQKSLKIIAVTTQENLKRFSTMMNKKKSSEKSAFRKIITWRFEVAK